MHVIFIDGFLFYFFCVIFILNPTLNYFSFWLIPEEQWAAFIVPRALESCSRMLRYGGIGDRTADLLIKPPATYLQNRCQCQLTIKSHRIISSLIASYHMVWYRMHSLIHYVWMLEKHKPKTLQAIFCHLTLFNSSLRHQSLPWNEGWKACITAWEANIWVTGGCLETVKQSSNLEALPR